ncbi:hypothetical protein DFH09DRAFT_1200316, partial [Mycena vulgaris]
MATIGFSYGSFGDITETIKIVVNIVAFIHNGGSASKEWKEMEQELKLLVTSLASLHSKLPPDLDPAVADRVTKEGALCKELMSQFENSIPVAFPGRLPKLRDLGKVIFQGKELEGIRKQLCIRRDALNEVIGLLTREESRLGNDRMEAGFSRVADQLTTQRQTLSDAAASVEGRINEALERAKLENKLQRWLQFSPDILNKHAATVALRHRNTGSWLLECEEFTGWESTAGVLWIQGQSGTGKTVLSSTVISELFKKPKPAAGATAVAYFYFDFSDQTQGVHRMLRTIILQLSAQSPHPYEALDKVYTSSNSKGQTLPTYAELEHVLGELLLEFEHTYIVLDALDECQPDTELDKLMNVISNLRAWSQSPLHLLITSQARDMFTDCFQNLPYIFLQPDVIQQDIQLFVSSEIHENRRFTRWADRASEIINRVVRKSSGMFRLAACLLVELSRCKHQNELDKTLLNLPEDLFGVYDRFMGAIDQKYHIYATGVLRWLMFSAGRYNALIELADAIAFDYADPLHPKYDPSLCDENSVAIPEWLEGLVTVYIHDWTKERRIALAHNSVRDYMLSDRFTEKFDHDLSAPSSHMFLARSCLGRLLYFADHPEVPLFSVDLDYIPAVHWARAVTDPYRLAIYAAKNWYHHFHNCDNQAALIPEAQRLLEYGSAQYRALYHLLSYGPDMPSPLYGCSEGGYTDIIPVLLADGADINQHGGKHGGALSVASYAGHTGTMRLLLEHGAHANVRDAEGETVLHAACRNGYQQDLVQLLLDHGADVNAQDTVGGETALHAVSRGDIAQ